MIWISYCTVLSVSVSFKSPKEGLWAVSIRKLPRISVEFVGFSSFDDNLMIFPSLSTQKAVLSISENGEPAISPWERSTAGHSPVDGDNKNLSDMEGTGTWGNLDLVLTCKKGSPGKAKVTATKEWLTDPFEDWVKRIEKMTFNTR